MQQYQQILEIVKFPVIITSAVFCLLYLCSKNHPAIKVIALACVAYLNLVLIYPQELKQTLGDASAYVAMSCFALSGLALTIFLFKFLKAGLTILCWFMITAILGMAAFPDISRSLPQVSTEEIAQGFHEQKAQVTAFLHSWRQSPGR